MSGPFNEHEDYSILAAILCTLLEFEDGEAGGPIAMDDLLAGGNAEGIIETLQGCSILKERGLIEIEEYKGKAAAGLTSTGRLATRIIRDVIVHSEGGDEYKAAVKEGKP